MKTITIDSHKIEANDSLITGNNNIIFGNNNRIAGDNNKIYGNNNVVIGTGNIAKGEYNTAKGSGNEVRDPFGNASASTNSSAGNPTSPQQFFAPIDIQQATSSPVINNNNNSFFQPISNSQFPPASPRGAAYDAYQSPVSPRGTYDAYQPPMNYPAANNTYFQPMASPRAMMSTPPPVAAYFVVSPSPVYAHNPFSPPVSPTPFASPFESQQKEAKEAKDKDLIEDGTLVFIINESESEYVREFCKIVSANSGQRVGCHLSCGRMCIVGLGDLNKIRDTITQLLPMLNLKLKEWSWNTFGKNVCSDKEVYYKRLFKEYTKEDVDCWRNKPTKIAA